MSKYGFYFKYIRSDGTITVKFFPNHDSAWPPIMEEFKEFLAGCGYVLPEEFND